MSMIHHQPRTTLPQAYPPGRPLSRTFRTALLASTALAIPLLNSTRSI